MKLSEHFTLEEMTVSEVAARLGLDNAPGATATDNLKRVAALMEEIRALAGGRPIVVHSGYRAPAVNRAVGGVSTSAHCFGLACDFVCPEFGTAYAVAVAILESDLEYDQLIFEYGWVHVGLAQPGSCCRQEALTKLTAGAAYESGIRS